MVKKAALVSLSSGIIGEKRVEHELKIGLDRLEAMGIEVVPTENALAGLDYIREHPEKRAEDLLAAFADDTVDMILSAIGGDDTYRLLPYLFGNGELQRAVDNSRNRKIFLGFSDTTVNHLMLHKVGLPTFYGQSFLADICELEPTMLPYTEHYFRELVTTGRIAEIRPSDTWYEERPSFGVEDIGTLHAAHPNGGFELLQGQPVFSGEILGGCIDTLYDIFDNGRYADSVTVCRRYDLFPSLEDWRGRILLLESSEEQMPPEKYRDALLKLKATGLFGVISGILVGKPMNEVYHAEYKQLLCEVADDPSLPILCNVSIGHALPRCIIPFGVPATVDAAEQVIRFSWDKL